MEKLKPLFDDIWLKRPLYEPDLEEEAAKDKELEELQKKVTEIETKQLIERSITQLRYARMNPGSGMLQY